jgi:hypothetical protein
VRARAGTNPHFASVAANEKQNVLAELETDFATLAIDLLEMCVFVLRRLSFHRLFPHLFSTLYVLCACRVVSCRWSCRVPWRVRCRYDSQDRATRDFARRIARGLKIGVVQGLLAKQTEWSITEPLRLISFAPRPSSMLARMY